MKPIALFSIVIAVLSGTAQAQPGPHPHVQRVAPSRVVVGRTDAQKNFSLRRNNLVVHRPGGELLQPQAARLTALRGEGNVGLRLKVVEAERDHQERANHHRHEVTAHLVQLAHGKALRPLPEEVRMELLKHARRLAMLVRIDALAKAAGDAPTTAKVAALTAAETERHEKRITALLAEPENPPATPEEAVTAEPGAAKTPEAAKEAQP